MTTSTGLVVPPQHSLHREVGGDEQLAPGTLFPPAIRAAIGMGHDHAKALSLEGRVGPQAALPVQPLPTSVAEKKFAKRFGIERTIADLTTNLIYPRDRLKALAAVQNNNKAFTFLDSSFRADSTIVLASIQKNDASQLPFADSSLKENPIFMLEATKIYHGALRYASIHLRRNPRFMLDAAKIDARALHYASPSLKENPAFRDAAAKIAGREIEPAPKVKSRAPEALTLLALKHSALAPQITPVAHTHLLDLIALLPDSLDDLMEDHPLIDRGDAAGAGVPSAPPPVESLPSSSSTAGKKRRREPDHRVKKDLVPVAPAGKGDRDGLITRRDAVGIKKPVYLVPYSSTDSYLGKDEAAALTKYCLAHVSVEPEHAEAYKRAISKVLDISKVDDDLGLHLKDYAAMMESPIGLPTFLHVGHIKEMGDNLGVFAREAISANTFLGCYSGKFVPSSTVVNFNYAVNIDDYCVDAADEGNYLRYANHSAEHPNVEMRYASYTDEKQKKKLIIAFYSIHPIPKGEQLLFPYGDAYDWSHLPEGKPSEVTPQTFMLNTETNSISKISARVRKKAE
ncbi:MAG: DUF4116 domain-containing protein [Chlamydiae bacterium]|nr:DUF4116 domain-containing protein [Chlamydiota bacterium]